MLRDWTKYKKPVGSRYLRARTELPMEKIKKPKKLRMSISNRITGPPLRTRAGSRITRE